MNEECLICKAPLEYLDKDIPMECAICHKTINSKTRCIAKNTASNSPMHIYGSAAEKTDIFFIILLFICLINSLQTV